MYFSISHAAFLCSMTYNDLFVVFRPRRKNSYYNSEYIVKSYLELLFHFQNDGINPEDFPETVYKTFLMNLCPRPDIDEIFTSQ